MFAWLANWWDGAELWLTQLSFPVQFALVIVVLAPICLGVAWVIDRAVDVLAARSARMRSDHGRPAVPPVEPPLAESPRTERPAAAALPVEAAEPVGPRAAGRD